MKATLSTHSIANFARRIVPALLFGLLTIALAPAEPARAWNHRVNPALLGVRHRPFLEIGVSQGVAASNSYFTAVKVLQPEFLIDLNEMSTRIGGSSLSLAGTVGTETHASLSLFGLTAGVYSSIDAVVTAGVPGSLFTVLADGNELGETYEGSAPVIGRVFAEAGAHAGYRFRDWEIGMKLGTFAPLLYSAPEAEVSYEFSTTGTATKFEGGVSIPAFSAYNLADPQIASADDILASFNGVKMDLGFVRVREDAPWFGANVGGITLTPAVVDNKISLDAEATATIDNPAGNLGGGDSSEAVSTDVSEFEPSFLGDADQEISMPLQAGGFYRSTLIPWIALTGHAQLYFSDPFLYSVGGMIEGDVFPLNLLYFGLGYDRVAWHADAGLRVNIRIMELGLNVGLASPRFGSMWGGAGLNADIFFAFGI